MTMLFERFNEKALRRALWAEGIHQVPVDALLVGVLKQGGGACSLHQWNPQRAAQVVKRLSLDVAGMIKTLQERTERASGTLPSEIPFAPECKKVLDAAVNESKDMGSAAIDPIHILLALLKSEDDSVKSLRSRQRSSEWRKKPKRPAKLGPRRPAAAADGMMDPLVGRDEEIDRAIQILARRSKIFGNPGQEVVVLVVTLVCQQELGVGCTGESRLDVGHEA
eukprot:Skav204265  [mRNA]  locus=scaffold912:253277:258495:- [translate_table: standard]